MCLHCYDYIINLIFEKVSFLRIECFLFLKLESPTPKDAWFSWYQLSGCGEENTRYFVNEFSRFPYYLPFDKSVAYHLKKL